VIAGQRHREADDDLQVLADEEQRFVESLSFAGASRNLSPP